MEQLKCLAITGGMGTGKSTVLKFFTDHDYVVYDSDKIVGNLLYDSQSPYYIELATAFDNWLGTDFRYQKQIEKTILRPYLEKTEKGFPISLEIVKPFVQSAIIDLYNEALIKGQKIVFEVPVLFEANWQHNFEKIMLITCSNMEVRISRIQKRSPHLSVEQIKQTINSQKTDDEKTPFSDFIVDNNSTLEHLKEKLVNILPDIDVYYTNQVTNSKRYKK